ncbi:hypothetical protein LJC68_05475 [Bacteroidales bacterium OttesenSCG-928-B11]|nr:hypothetical protein [Bacteroidales bacterium OttesenSCG-928-B11]MDL2326453.1 hypothetical protein [Bacteroidales bacterium OttesenSCG-928-A14]
MEQNAMTTFMKLFKYLATLFLLFFVLPTHAQFYNGSKVSFGKNRVQHQHFNWMYYRTEKFDVYYYPTSQDLAEYTAYRVTEQLGQMQRWLSFHTSKKILFVVYNTEGDFRESNFNFDNDDFYNQGGVTNIYGTKIYLYFDGNHNHFDNMIRSGLMEVMARLIVEGESVASNIGSETMMSIPNWFYSGLSSFVGNNWDSEIDAYVKDGILTQKYLKTENLSAKDAMYAGHSFWKFVQDRFGANVIPNILYAVRALRSCDKGFYYVTGVPMKQLMTEWFRHYYVIYKKETKDKKPEGEQLLKRFNKNREYQHFAYSPDGKSYAYVTNEAGQIKIWLKNEKQKKPKVIFKHYKKVEDAPDLTYPNLAWHPTGDLLGFTLEDKGLCYYYPYLIQEGKMEKRIPISVEKITSWSYAPDGRMVAFSGFKQGQSDIYLFSLQSRSVQNLTNDIYDDYQPVFLGNQSKIVFSSNRPVDSVQVKDRFYEANFQKKYDLFMYDYGKKDPNLLRVTHKPYSDETDVVVLNEREILFVSDENGIKNRYIAVFDSVISRIDTAVHYAYIANSFPLSDNGYSILGYDLNRETNEITDIIQYKGVKRFITSPLQTKPLKQSGLSHFQAANIEMQNKVDSARKIIAKNEIRKRHGFFQVYASDLAKQEVEKDTVITQKATDGVAKVEDKLRYVAPRARYYNTQFTLNKLITQADFSFLNTSYQQYAGGTSPIYLNTGINALFMLGITDVFEDYRLSAGFRLSFDLNSNEFMLSYEDLSKRIDKQVVFYRQSLTSSLYDGVVKQRSNSIFFILKYPFHKYSALRFTLTARYENLIVGVLDDRTLEQKDESRFWGGAKLEYIFDSSKDLYTNLWRGTKFKMFAEYEHKIAKDQLNLLVVGFDYRKSVRLFKNVTWVNRLAGSTNLGSGRLVYFMGGVDSWVGAKFDTDINVDQTKNYTYQTLATNMRGFKQNIRNGTSFMVLNSELRFPIVQLMTGRMNTYNFWHSIQLLVFGDLGTAWTGVNPYSEENSLYSRTIQSGSMIAIVKRDVDPLVLGFGAGLRASLAGYFLRFDYAWGLEDWRILDKNGQFMFSIGFDF